MDINIISINVFDKVAVRLLLSYLKIYSELEEVNSQLEKFSLSTVTEITEANVIIVNDVVLSSLLTEEMKIICFNLKWLKDLMKGYMLDDDMMTPLLTSEPKYRPFLVSNVPNEVGAGRVVGLELDKSSNDYKLASEILGVCGSTPTSGGSLVATWCIRPAKLTNVEFDALKILYPAATEFIDYEQFIHAVWDTEILLERLKSVSEVPIHSNLIIDLNVTVQVQKIIDALAEKLKDSGYLHYFPMTKPAITPKFVPEIGYDVITFDFGQLDNVQIFEALEKDGKLKIFGRHEIISKWDSEYPVLQAASFHANPLDAKKQQELIHKMMRETLQEQVAGMILLPTETKNVLIAQTASKNIIETSVTEISKTRYRTLMTVNTNLLACLKQMMKGYGSSPYKISQKPKKSVPGCSLRDCDWSYDIQRGNDKLQVQFRNGVTYKMKTTISDEFLNSFCKVNTKCFFLLNALFETYQQTVNANVSDSKEISKSDIELVNLVCTCDEHIERILLSKNKFSPRWMGLSKSSKLKCCVCESNINLKIVFLMPTK